MRPCRVRSPLSAVHLRTFAPLLAIAAAVLAWPSLVTAVPMIVNSQDTSPQDILITNPNLPVHELGNAPAFPPNELIVSSWLGETPITPCPISDNPNMPNVVVEIINMTGHAWPWLYYVADPETSLTNDDGLVNGQRAFQIDSVGLNTPLVYESLISNNMFDVGETWHFVIQDYTNALGLQPHLFGSIGVGPLSMGDLVSSGSIVPEPTTLALLALGGFALIRRRRVERR